MRNILLAIAAIAVSSISSDGKSPATARDEKTVTAENYLDQFVDRSVSPRDDFFHFAVGKWLKAHQFLRLKNRGEFLTLSRRRLTIGWLR